MDKLTEFLIKPFIEKDTLNEGINDPGILKAVFLAGGPGSGKGFISKGLFGIPKTVSTSAYGLKVVNQDKALEMLLGDGPNGFGFGTDLDNMPPELFRQLTDPDYEDYSGMRTYAKDLTKRQKKLYMNGRLGMIIDGTGHKYKKILDQKKELEKIGYDCFMVFVHTDLDVAQKRNMERARKLNPELVETSWNDVQKNLISFQGLFGNTNFMMVDNSKTLGEEAAIKKFDMLMKKGIRKFIKQPIKNYLGKKWIAKQKIMKESIDIPVEIGDTVLMGRFKNKRVVVKSIDYNEKGDLLINGRTALKFRIKKKDTNEEFGAPPGFLPSPSRKMVKKMKRKGNTSVPYGSGYDKVNEKLSRKDQIKQNKLRDMRQKLIKKAIGFGSGANSSKLKLQIKDIEKQIDKLNEATDIKKTIGVFGGRFQPFHSGHLATYNWLKTQVDEAYITTSNLKMPPRHPMNFKEKVSHMIKMGIPKNRIIMEKSPYVAKNLLSKFDSKTTSVIYAVGKKDSGRLGGKYFKPYTKDMKGFDEHGYLVTAPKFGSVSGTQMRKLLGDPKIDDSERAKAFKKVFGYYDKAVYTMMTNSFKKLFEEFTLSDDLIEDFLIDVDITKILKEGSANTNIGSDDGPGTFYQGFSDYYRVSKDDLPAFMDKSGWSVINYLIGKKSSDPDLDYSLIYDPISSVTFDRAGSIAGTTDATEKYKARLKSIIGRVGGEIIKWMGIDGKGLRVSTIPDAEYGRGKTGWAWSGTKGKTGKLTKQKQFNFSPSIKERINLDDEVKLIVEGGAYGHLNHPFDDKNLTFSEFKTLIINTLQGNLDSEGAVTEKTDGQNIMVSWKNGKLLAARNKGHIKNFGANALSVDGIKSMFAGRGDIEKAFVYSMRDLENAVGKLSDAQKTKIFDEGKKFMSLEVIYPKTVNVIPYDKSLLQFHGTIEYDAAGSPIGEDRGSARVLAGMIKQINQDVQKAFKIEKPFVTNLPKVKDFSKRQSYFLGKLNKLQNNYGLRSTDTLADYHQAYWMEYILNGANQTDFMNITNDILVKLTKRWAFFDKSYKIPQIKKDLKEDHPEFLDWVLATDKNDHARLQKEHIRDWEVLFFELGAEILSNLSDFIAANPSKAAQKIRKDLKSAISKVKKSKDPKVLNTLKVQLDRLDAIGGLKSVVPSEGITFVYKGKLYKYTGAFAPANQILGMLKFV